MAAQPGDVELWGINIVAAVFHGALNFYIRHQIVHAVSVFRNVDLPQPEGPIKAVT